MISAHFYIVSYYIKWVTTSWTYIIIKNKYILQSYENKWPNHSGNECVPTQTESLHAMSSLSK